jgi:hypothetical protein
VAQARASRMRAPAQRAPARGTSAGSRSGPSRNPLQGTFAPQQVPSQEHAAESSEFDAVLDLQESAGNRAVVQLLAGRVAATEPDGFPGAGNRALGVVLARPTAVARSIALQREMAAGTDPKLRAQMLRDAIRFEPLFYRFVIDADKTGEALSNLTAEDGRTVKALFKEWKGWNLGWVLSAVETPIEDGPAAPNNLSQAERTKFLNLLAGTVAKAAAAAEPELAPAPAATGEAPAGIGGAAARPGGAPATPAPASAAPAPDPDARRVRQNRLRVTASSIKAAVGKKDVATAIALIPRTMEERREVDEVYKSMYGRTAYMDLFTKLPGKQGQRAAALWYDERDDADRLALEAAQEERDKANKEADEIEGAGSYGGPAGLLGPVAKARRREGEEKVQAALKQVAKSGDQGSVAGRAASQDHLKKVIEAAPSGSAARKIDIKSEGLNKAIAEGDEAAELASRLARSDAAKDVTPDQLEAALRSLRQLATDAAEREIDAQPEALEPIAETVTKRSIDAYYDRFVKVFNDQQMRRTFDLVLAGKGGTDEEIAKLVGVPVDMLREASGKSADVARNKALLAGKGEIPEWQEVFFALNRDPKDYERVREILGTKTRSQVQILSADYTMHTGLRSLEVDLAGTEAEAAYAKLMGGEVREGLQHRRAMLAGGEFDREQAEGRVPANLDDEGRKAYLLQAEGTFLGGKISALERRVIENRGYFAKVRDWAGNEEKSILDLAGEDTVRAKAALAKAITPDRGSRWKAGEEGAPLRPNLAEAERQVKELRRIEARMSHAVGIYKEATKKAYEEFVDLVVNAATIAAGLGVTGIWLTALRTTAATVGTKLLMKGSDYSVDEFIGDIEGGMAGVAGDFAKLGFKQLVAPYVTSKILRFARKVGMSKAFYDKVEAKVGGLAMRQAEHTIGTGVSNVAQGKSWTEGQGVGDRLKGEVIGQVTGPIDERMKARKAAKAIVKRARAEAGEEPTGGRPQHGEEHGPGGRPRGAESGAGDADVATATTEPSTDTDAGAPAPASDEGPAPKVSMALPEPAHRAGKPAPPVEPAPAPRSAPGALAGQEHMAPPRTDGSATDRQRSGGKEKRTAPGPGAAHPLKGDGGGETAAKSLEYPAGATQLNAPGGAAPAAPGHAAAKDLEAQPRSDRFQRQATERLRQAEERMRMVNELGMTEGPMHGDALRSLQEAQGDYDVAHGKRPATLDELRRIADDDVAEAELDYALAKNSDAWKAREKVEREHAAAIEEQRRAKSAVGAAHAWVLNVQARDPDPTTLKAAFDAYEAANARLKAATEAVGPAAARRERAAAADWKSRRAWTALRMAREQQRRASGRATPPPPPNVRKGGRPTEGPIAPFEEGPHEQRFAPELWDKELVIQLKNTTSLREHEQLVYQMLRDDPTREIGLFRNSKSGEWIVVRGKKMTVVVESQPGSGDEKGGSGPRGAGQRQRWKELLDHGSDVGEWELIAHSHPTERGQRVTRIAQYPSGYKGDFSVLRAESDRDGQPRSSSIYYLDNGVRRTTTFGYDPRNMRPYWIQLPGEPPRRFTTLQAYHDHLKASLAQVGVVPQLDPIPSFFPESFGFEGTEGEDGEP